MPRARAHADVVPIRSTTPALPDTAVADGYHPELPLHDIDPNPKNVRRNLGDLTELVASIRAVGVRHPVTVTPVSHIGDAALRWVLVDGHRRYAAAEQAGLTTIPGIVRTDIASDVDVITEMLRAGILQERLSPIEEASAYLQLELLGLSAGDIAKRVGRSRSTVEQRLHLMDLPETVRERVHARSMTLDEAAAVAEFAALVERWPAAKNWTHTLEGAAGTSEWQFTLSRARHSWEGEQKRQEARELVASLGVLLVPDSAVASLWEKRVQPSWYTAAELANAASDDGSPLPASVPPEVLAHADCPNAVAVVTVGGYISWLCLLPKQHERVAAVGADAVDEPLGGASNAVPYAEEDPWAAQRELEQAWLAVEQEKCRAAADARQTWLREVLLPGRKAFTTAQASALARYVAGVFVAYTIDLQVTPWLEWLGVDLDALDDVTDDFALEGKLKAELAKAKDPQRSLLAGIASEQESPREAGNVQHWVRPGRGREDVRAWIELLTELGYQPCTWEDHTLARALGMPGICRTCSCTQDLACEDGLSSCWWVIAGVYLCSKCARAEVAAATTDG